MELKEADLKNKIQKKKANGFLKTEWFFPKPKKPDKDIDVDVDKDIDIDEDITTTVSDSCDDGLQKVLDFYNNNIGLITPYGVEIFSDYINDMSAEVIIFAMQKAVEANVRTIKYIKATLNNWKKAGVKNLLQAKEESNRFKNKNATVEETDEEKKARKLKKLEEALKNDEY